MVGSRLACLATVAVVLSLSTAEVAVGDGVSPTELELGESAQTGAPASVPLAVVSTYTKKLEAENKHLKQINTALRTESEVDQAKIATAIAGGIIPPLSAADANKAAESPEQKQAEKELPPPVADMPVEMRKGMKVVDDYAKKNKELENKVQASKGKVDAMTAQKEEDKIDQKEKMLKMQEENSKEPSTYHRIPFLKFSAGSKSLPQISSAYDCQDVCDRQEKCQSYSWSESSKTCMWSVDKIQYDDAFVFEVKAQVATAGDPAAVFRQFPGLKYVTMGKHKDSVDYKACQTICLNDISCKSFSYRSDTKYCNWGTTGLAYNKEFNYFEKNPKTENAATVNKEEQLQKAHDKLKQKIVKHQQEEAAEEQKEAHENSMKKEEKARWLSDQPTNSQESHLKLTVKMEMESMDAKFANQNSEKKKQAMMKAQQEFDKAQLAVVGKVSHMEAELKDLQVKKKEAADKVGPAEDAKNLVEIAIAKLKAKLKILAIDLKLKSKAVENAEQALNTAQKSQNDAAIATTTEAYNDAKKAIVDNEDEKGKTTELLSEKVQTLHTKQAEYESAVADERKYKTEVKGQEAKNKDEVKAEKMALEKQKQLIEGDKEKAFTAKVVALKAKEKTEKSRRATAKVDIWKVENELKDGSTIKTEDDRREAEKAMASARGTLFKAEQANDELSHSLLEAARTLAATKEKLHKVKASAQKAKEADKRENVENKLAKLENAVAPAPVR